MSRGSDPNAAKNDGSSPLHLCAARGLFAMAQLLLDQGAVRTSKTVSGSSPADRARLFRDDRLVRLLTPEPEGES